MSGCVCVWGQWGDMCQLNLSSLICISATENPLRLPSASHLTMLWFLFFVYQHIKVEISFSHKVALSQYDSRTVALGFTATNRSFHRELSIVWVTVECERWPGPDICLGRQSDRCFGVCEREKRRRQSRKVGVSVHLEATGMYTAYNKHTDTHIRKDLRSLAAK